ncbi:MAG: hypothetical protein C9356_14940 [Oleiphilus sp.]|nr:MAG: hypothetical protein C9356_14940 [Oleiphilus sp.]
MSHYITATGSLSYANKNDLLASIDPLVKGGWLSCEDGQYLWRDEAEQLVLDENAVSMEDCSIVFPYSSYRNVSRVLDAVLAKATDGQLKWYSTDGDYYLRAWSDGRQTLIDSPELIVKVARTEDQGDLDVLTMQSEEWEARYQDCDFFEALHDVMEAALDRL